MSVAASRHVIQALRRVAAAPADDAELLTRFITDHDEAAFARIVQRHGPLVLGTCRRILGNAADADDAFQAVFLALARNPTAVRRRASLSAWLYGAAYRVCLKARRQHARSRPRARFDPRPPAHDPLTQLSARELLVALNDELAQLPDRFRLPVVLCLVEGLTQCEAAERLGWSAGSVKGRLERGRERLRRRLAARGMTLAAVLSATVVCEAGVVSPMLVRRATELASGGAVPEMVGRLAAAALPSSAVLGRPMASLMLGAIFIAVAVGVGSEKPAETPPRPAPPAAAKPRVDRFGDPLPEGAVMRLGTVGFRVPFVESVGFRHDGQLLALSGDLTLRTWPLDGSTKSTAIRLPAERRGSPRLALSPDGRFAGALVARRFVVWDLTGADPVEYLARDTHEPYTICFSPDGRWLAVNEHTRGHEGVLLCDIAQKTWKQVSSDRSADSLSFSADGKSLVIVSYPNVIVVNTATGQPRLKKNVERLNARYAALSPDGSLLAVAPVTFIHGKTPSIQLISVPDGVAAAGLKVPEVSATWLAFGGDGKSLMVGGSRGIRLWDLAAGKLIREYIGPAYTPAAVSRDGRWIASCNDDAISVWDANTGQHVRPELRDAGHVGKVMNVAVSPDGKFIATSGTDNEVRVWAADSGRPVARFQAQWAYERPVVFLPDSKSLIGVASDYVTPAVFEAASGKELRRFAIPAGMGKTEMTKITRLSADGKELVTTSTPVVVGDPGYTVRWDVITGRVIERTKLSQEALFLREMGGLAHSPDGHWSAQFGAVARVDSGDMVQVVPAQEFDLFPATFGDDSRFVATGRLPRTASGEIDETRAWVVVFDLHTRAKIVEVPAPPMPRAAFSADGRLLGISGRGEVAIWDLATSKPVRRFLGGADIKRSMAIAFTPDGRRLITGHDDCTALVWDLGERPKAGPLSPAELARHWEALAGDDAAKAYAAEWELADRPAQAIEFLRERLKPVRPADGISVRELVAGLSAAVFAEREAASKKLGELGEAAIPHLKALLKAGLPAEAKVRVERLLVEFAAPVLPPGERLRQLRAVAVLEHAATDDARKLLKELAGGIPDARLTREAGAALQRMAGTKREN